MMRHSVPTSTRLRLGLLTVAVALLAFGQSLALPVPVADARRAAPQAAVPGLSQDSGAHPPALRIDARRNRQFGIYYGWPSRVNGADGDVDAAVATFSQFAVVVFGDGLMLPSHPDHQPSAAIVRRLREGGTRVFGYVDLGVTTQNLTVPTILERAEAWRQMGATGIFLDDAGRDYGVDETRRDAAVAGIHRLGLPVILNAHDPDDAFRGRVRLRPGDGYLFESFQISDGTIVGPEHIMPKADRALQHGLESGVEIYTVASGPPDDPAFGVKYAYAWWSVLLYGFDYFQYTTIDYSAFTGRLALYPQEAPDLGSRYLDGAVQHAWDARLHRRLTDRGEIRVQSGSPPSGTFVPHRP